MTRRRSLKKDVNDWKQFRFGRDRHMGFSVSTEFYQPVPFFYTREGANLNVLGHYRGGSIFIVCNGPSLASGDYDLSLLKRPGVMTYGMNNGAKTIRPNFWTCVDDPKRFLKSIWLDPCITKFVPHAHAEKSIFDNEAWQETQMLVGQCPNVMYYHRNEKFMADRFLFEDTINWGNSGENGGGRSVFLPVLRICFLLGFRNIYLLGADFKMSSNYTYHFDEQRAKGAVNCNNNTYDRLKNDYLPSLKPYLEAEGVNVFNCNPDSELKTFDYMPYEQAIQSATAHMGDVDNERTWGMYSKPSERQKWKQEPDDSQKAHLAYIRNRPLTPVYDVPPHQAPMKPTQQASQAPVMSPEPNLMPDPPSHASTIFEQPHGTVIPMDSPEMQQMRDMVEKRSQTREVPIQMPQTPQPMVKLIPDPTQQATTRRIIKSLPCGSISQGSSVNPSNNITIFDDEE